LLEHGQNPRELAFIRDRHVCPATIEQLHLESHRLRDGRSAKPSAVDQTTPCRVAMATEMLGIP